MNDNNTLAIQNKIESAKTDKDFLDIKNQLQRRDLGEKINNLKDKYSVSTKDILKYLSISKTQYHYIVSGQRNASRLSIIKIAFVLGATREELDELLKTAGYKELYAKDNNDSILIYCLKKGYDIVTTEEKLIEFGASIRLLQDKSE